VSYRIEVRDRSTEAEIAACLNAAGGDFGFGILFGLVVGAVKDR
jgi:hypothetical protein